MLNPKLYEQLSAISGGRVKIVNENEPFVYKVCPVSNTITRESGGEQYRLCCPICNDDKYRLYVSHRYGTVEPITGKRLWGLAKCLHGRSHPTIKDMRFPCSTDWLYHRLRGIPLNIVATATAPTQPQGIELPGNCIPLPSLTLDHPAVAYVSSRGVNPAWLLANYDVSYCQAARNKVVSKRLVFPFYGPMGYLGFQARAIPGHSETDEPKYYIGKGMSKSSFLFNAEGAIRTGLVIVTEGIFSALACGINGVCTFGKEISQKQVKILADGLRFRGTVVVAYDGDAQEFNYKAYKKLLQVVPRVEILKLPDAKDPGDLGFNEMHGIIKERFNVDIVC